MKVLMINSVCGIGSTGRICTDLAQQFEKDGHKVKIAFGRDPEKVPENLRKYGIYISNPLDMKIHGIKTRIFDEHGLGSKKVTKDFVTWAEKYNPDLLWLHNIHGYYLNYEILFEWIKSRPNMKVKWTLHDCWSFTGHCSHFSYVGCYKWKKHCKECVQKDQYPISLLKDNSYDNFERKKSSFTGVKNMTLITPSKWLANLVKESFMKEYPIEVHYNTVDASIFKPTSSDFREKYGIENNKIILGVASIWTKRKGLEDFIKLTGMLSEKYVIVLVGLSKEQIEEFPLKVSEIKRDTLKDSIINIDERKIKRMPAGIVVPQDIMYVYKEVTNNIFDNTYFKSKAKYILLERTESVDELVELYSTADFFVNTTYEDNYPTVNLEAIACGTRVITYNTGGCIETLS